MALSKEVYGQVGTPRVYIDYHTYAEAIGYVKEYYGHQVDPLADKGFAFGLNPGRTIEYTIDTAESASQTISFVARYKNWNSENAPNSNPQFSRFMGTANYFGLLGHNLSKLISPSVAHIRLRMYNFIDEVDDAGDDALIAPDTSDTGMVVSSIVGDTHNLGNELGYSLYEIETPFDVDVCGSVSAWIWFDSAPVPQWSTFNLGSFTFGRFLDFPVAPDLNVSLSYDYSGIKSQKTISGEEITNINYYQSPNWGELAPWTHINVEDYADFDTAINSEDYSAVRRGGRRTFKVSFSYIDKTDMFPKHFEGNMSGLYHFGGEELGSNQINNAGFGTDTIWDKGSGWAITGGKAVATTSTSSLSQFATMDGGTEFKVTFTATNFDAGSFKIKLGTDTLGYTESETLQSAGTYDLYMTSPGTTNDSVDFIIDAVTSLTVKLDNVYAKPLITPASEWFDHDSSIIGTFLNFTMGGQLPFIFQPDNTKQDFAICRLDKAASTAKQVAPGVYSLSMVFVETW